MKLTIISHTEHFMNEQGNIVGWGPTITEINHLLDVFDSITHVAMLHKGKAPESALPYSSDRVEFISIPALGGPRFSDKLAIIKNIPKIWRIVRKAVKKNDYFQFRAPTGIGVFIIPLLILFNSKKGWFKYAGNWKQDNAPLSYSFQRWLLKRQSRKVTINGKWQNQLEHCLSFENPCLTTQDLATGKRITNDKSLPSKITFCFVGRLETEKGVDLIIRAITTLNDLDRSKIEKVHLVGDGKEKENFIDMTKTLDVNFVFHGFLPRIKVNEIYAESHAFILPSASEGFPKVISEALNYGCIPIVSDISSIGHYIKDGTNGFLIHPITVDAVAEKIKEMLLLSPTNYRQFIEEHQKMINSFTFDHYNNRIKNEILE